MCMGKSIPIIRTDPGEWQTRTILQCKDGQFDKFTQKTKKFEVVIF